MARRSALITQSDATRFLKAARSAGYPRARIVTHGDGRVERIAENVEIPSPDPEALISAEGPLEPDMGL